MSHALNCLLCGAPVADSTAISKDIVSSGNVIFVSGIQYAQFEALTRHVFTAMPIDFKNHSGACFAKYRSVGAHNVSFTLVVTGEGNNMSPAVLKELLPHVSNIFAFGQMSREEVELLTGGSMSLPRKTARMQALGIEDWAEYYAVGIKSGLVAMDPDPKL